MEEVIACADESNADAAICKNSGERSARHRKTKALEYGDHDTVPNLEAAVLFSAWLNLN